MYIATYTDTHSPEVELDLDTNATADDRVAVREDTNRLRPASQTRLIVYALVLVGGIYQDALTQQNSQKTQKESRSASIVQAVFHVR